MSEVLEALREEAEFRRKQRELLDAHICRLGRQGLTPTEIHRRVDMSITAITRVLVRAAIVPSRRGAGSLMGLDT